MEGLDGGGRWWLSARGGGSQWLTMPGGRTASRSRWLCFSQVSSGARRSPPCYRTDRLRRRRAAAVGRRTVTGWFVQKRERGREWSGMVMAGNSGGCGASLQRWRDFFPAAGNICVTV
ncbi:transcriptional factor B3 family protein [Striga asiatica]|uniref:Transcriptional factor B3 family protein n=1 Tax=Striga asiatica TaxID=4170 RepID=A0A5A7PYD4_STRAF|nr:transcriptional factor B3 family protein [Striga asiatica]